MNDWSFQAKIVAVNMFVLGMTQFSFSYSKLIKFMVFLPRESKGAAGRGFYNQYLTSFCVYFCVC